LEKSGNPKLKIQKLNHESAETQLASESNESVPMSQIDTGSIAEGVFLVEPEKILQASAYTTKGLVLEMLALLIEEFNCNHQADLESAD
jgi:hypothetical protein